jgi:hypothetical protein
MLSLGLSACSLSAAQRSATISFGRTLDQHGQLIAEESTYIRSQVKLMRVLAMSLPNSKSASLFSEAAYEKLADGVQEPEIERMVQIGGAASKFGQSLADVAEIASSTASEKVLSAATQQLALTAGAISSAASGVSVGAAAVNFTTFISLEAYRRTYLRRELPAAEPAFRAAQKDLDAAFDARKTDSLLSVFAAATAQLAALLEESYGPAGGPALPASDRKIVAESYRVLARNRDHIKYVTSRQLDLSNKSGAAYDSLRAAFEGDDSRLDAVQSYSAAVFSVHLAFQSLK